MNILNKLSIKNLKLNKKRTISTVIGIVLSVSLICAVSCMGESFKATLVENAVNEYGYYHVKISDVSEDNLKDIKNNRDIKNIYETIDIGYAKLNGSQNKEKPYAHIYSMNNETFDNLKFKLIDGRFAKNSDELVISKHIFTNGKVNLKVGDTITLEIGKRMSEGCELNSNNPYIESDVMENTESNEELQLNLTKDFKIVGIIERPNYKFENYGSAGYTVITTNMNEGHTDIYLSLKKPTEYKTSITELLGANNYNEVLKVPSEHLKYENWDINRELLRWEALAFSDSTVSMLYSVIAVVIFIIIFTSVFCIRNSFAISATEKIKMYGMLASCGATKKQIKKNVIFESMILGLIGIPLGIISGIFAVFVLLKIVNMILGEYLLSHVDGIVFNVSIFPVIISIILGIITIYLSAISSARKSAKVSPIENLRNSNDVRIKSKKLKVPKVISKIFKTGGVLAYKNLKRSKKKYRTTVISLTVSVFIFIAMNAFITNMFDLTGHYFEDYDYNFEITSNLNNISQEQIKKIVSYESVEEYFMLYEIGKHSSLTIKDLSKINQIDENELSENEKKYSSIQLMALDDSSFEKYCKKVGADYENAKGKGILVDNYLYFDGKNKKELRRYKYIEDDKITGEFKDTSLSIEVAKVTKIRPYGIEKTYYGGGYLILDIDEFKNLGFELDILSIHSNNNENLKEYIKNENIDVEVYDLEAAVKEEKSMVLVIKIFLYGFIAVIALIGVTNIFNTITSNMELRQKEFAMLKSIGMTKKEFNRMINLETLFYGTKSLIYGTVLGLLGTFAIYKAFSVKIDSGMYVPINPIIISAICIFILVFIIMRYSIAKINKQNTIETIRKENI